MRTCMTRLSPVARKGVAFVFFLVLELSPVWAAFVLELSPVWAVSKCIIITRTLPTVGTFPVRVHLQFVRFVDWHESSLNVLGMIHIMN